jgi:hypothetical protein
MAKGAETYKAMNNKQGANGGCVRSLARPTVEELDRNFETALQMRLRGEYMRGKAEGLRVAKVIRGWLARQPDRKWQRQAREWADNEIKNAENDLA